MTRVPPPTEAADERIVVADDRVLNRVGERQQHHQVKGVHLPQLAAAADPQDDDQEDVHRDGPDDLLGQAGARHKQVLEELAQGIHQGKLPMLGWSGRHCRPVSMNARHSAHLEAAAGGEGGRELR